MPINIQIDDTKLDGFNSHARQELQNNIEGFSNDLIAEANRMEASINRTSAGPQITSTIVNDAHVFLRHRVNKPKITLGKIALKVGASVFSLLAGIMYQKDELQSTGYFVFYILIIALAILLTTLVVLKEE